MTDFGADESFSYAAKKAKEHYGIDVSINAIRQITELHAANINEKEEMLYQEVISKQSKTDGIIISEIDGSMVPIVEIVIPDDKKADELDLRKHRTLLYKEARLAMSHQQGSVTPVYAATMGDVDEAGKQLRITAEVAGMGSKTKIHGVGLVSQIKSILVLMHGGRVMEKLISNLD